jgi:hypothetical protein
VRLKSTKGLSLKEEEGEMISDCPSSSNSYMLIRLSSVQPRHHYSANALSRGGLKAK